MQGSKKKRLYARHGPLAIAAVLSALATLLPASAGAAKRANPQAAFVTVDPATVAAGGEFDSTATFFNPHKTTTKRRWMLFRIFSAAGGNGHTLSSGYIPKLKPGSRVEITVGLELNPGKKPGDYDIVACRTPRKNHTRCGPNQVDAPLTVVGSQLLGAAPTSRDFGTREIGTTSGAETITFTNEGQAPTGELDLQLTGAAAQFATSADGCSGVTLEPGDECTVDVAFAPVSAGAKDAHLVLSGIPGGSAAADLSGAGADPAELTITPSGKDYADTVVGSNSSIETYTVTNAGGVPSGALSTAVSGADSGQFSIQQDSCDGQTLAAAGTCTITARFSPASRGDKTASLDATASPGGTASSVLTGKGLAPAGLSLTPASWDFGSTLVGQVSASKTFTVTNTGDVTANNFVYNDSGTDPGDFDFVGTTCPPQIDGGASCEITVEFNPTADGARSAQLDVSANPGLTDSSPLSGTGLAPAQLAISPSSWDYGNVQIGTQSQTKMFTVTNTGDQTSGDVDLFFGNGFFPVGNTCTGTLAGGASCQVGVLFQPQPPTGSKSWTFTVAANPGGSDDASLTGTAVATAANLQISETAANATSPGAYGNSASWQDNVVFSGTNATRVWLKNTGEADAYVSNSPVPLIRSGAYAYALSGTCPITYGDSYMESITFWDLRLAGGSECYFDLRARGETGTAFSVDFTIQSSPGGSVSGRLFNSG